MGQWVEACRGRFDPLAQVVAPCGGRLDPLAQVVAGVQGTAWTTWPCRGRSGPIDGGNAGQERSHVQPGAIRTRHTTPEAPSEVVHRGSFRS